jgi:hypothetical protein
LKIKIGQKVYDSDKDAMLFLFQENERKQLIKFLQEKSENVEIHTFCVHPENMSDEEAEKFMYEDTDEYFVINNN